MIDKIIKILENNTEVTICYEDGECYEMIPDGNFKETADDLNDLFALHVVGISFRDLKAMTYEDIAKENIVLRKRLIEVDMKLNQLNKTISVKTRKIDKYSPE